MPHRLAARVDPPAFAAWTLSFTLVAYLALSNGGYETVVRSQVGVAVWWIVLLGAVAGLLPSRVGTAGWVAIALLTGFAAWTGLASGWSESAERSATELGRVATYLGVLVLAVASLWDTLRARRGVVAGSAPERAADFEWLLQLVAANELTVVVDRTFPLDHIVDAYRLVDSGHKRGNVIVRP